jgi:hypothetical protein
MSHFAQVIDGIVQQVIVAEQDFINTLENSSQWIQTSYNTKFGHHFGPDGELDNGVPFRGNYARVGDTYDAINDVFYAPKPIDKNGIVCNSWTLSNKTWDWIPPKPEPKQIDGTINSTYTMYAWDEKLLDWVVLETVAGRVGVNTF